MGPYVDVDHCGAFNRLVWTAGHCTQGTDQSRSVLDGTEVILVSGLNSGEGEPSDLLPLPGEAKPKRSRIVLVRLARDQTLFLQGANDLRGHHHVRPGMVSQLALTWLSPVRGEPPGAGQEDELDVSQAQGPQGSGHRSLPA
jgi:hypothetical protein